MAQTSNIRYQWVDTCKTIGLLLVIIGHGRLLEEEYQQWIFSFHMPLFFVLSGMLYKYKSPLETIKHDFKRFLIPYLIINMICLVIQGCIMAYLGQLTITNFIHRFIAIFVVACHSGDFNPVSAPTWFIIALFIDRIMLSLNKNGLYYICMFILSIIGCVLLKMIKFDIWIPFDSAMMAFPFLVIGYYSKTILYRHFDSLFSVLFIILSVSCLTLFNYLNGPVDMNSNSYGKYILLFYFDGILGTLLVIVITKKLPKMAIDGFCSMISKGALLIVG